MDAKGNVRDTKYTQKINGVNSLHLWSNSIITLYLVYWSIITPQQSIITPKKEYPK